MIGLRTTYAGKKGNYMVVANARILELALKGLEAERASIQNEIATLESQIRRAGGRLATRAKLLPLSTFSPVTSS